MKDIIRGLFVVIVGVAILVGGYYLGIILALIGGAAVVAGIVLFIICFVMYAVYDLFTTKKSNSDD